MCKEKYPTLTKYTAGEACPQISAWFLKATMAFATRRPTLNSMEQSYKKCKSAKIKNQKLFLLILSNGNSTNLILNLWAMVSFTLWSKRISCLVFNKLPWTMNFFVLWETRMKASSMKIKYIHAPYAIISSIWSSIAVGFIFYPWSNMWSILSWEKSTPMTVWSPSELRTTKTRSTLKI